MKFPKEFRVVVAGSRNMTNYPLLKQYLDDILANIKEDIVIVSGRARGADTLGEQYAKEKKYNCTMFPANWDKYGNLAGPYRNKQMLEYADAVVVFMYPNSRGSANMAKIAKESGKPLRVINLT